MMNEFASAHALDLAMWATGGLFTVLAILIGVIYRLNERRHEKHELKLAQIDVSKVDKPTLDRVEATWARTFDAMAQQRKEMHLENKEALKEIKDSIVDVHTRIDEVFRDRRG